MGYEGFEDIVVSVEEGIARLRIDREDRLNALRSTTYREVVEVCRQFQRDPDVRVVVCTHTGRGFSAGADVTDPSRAERSKPESAVSNREFVYAIGEAMPLIDKPTIASINGVCAGAGFGFAASFDIRFLGPGARFLTAFAKQGVGPDCGLSFHLPKLVGHSRALELFYTTREVGAEEAERIGLGTLVEDPDEAALALARQLAVGPRGTFMWSKRLVQRASRSLLQEHLDLESAVQQTLRVSPEAIEGSTSFREKRTPHFP
ncbi:MAG: enoyl-CoA hydratase-related protein [Dehalococcoidia bacterium]|nr:enoyl-CoA hydratase-related protein [Dehalococcoidia bacterium]